MSLLRSVGARLSLALALVVAVALAVAYAIVVPRLERNLVQAKLDQLTRSAEAAGADFPTQTDFPLTRSNYEFEIETFRIRAAEATNANVFVFENPFAASRLRAAREGRAGRGAGGGAEEARLIAAAALAGSVQRGVVIRDGKRFAEVAYPVLSAYGEMNVVLFVASLEDTLANVKLVERRLLVAGGLALLVSLPIGFGAASLFARRIRRLERAAYRIAGGRLDEPVEDRGNDELGQLARAFERMRQQLAHLEHARREFIANASHELRTPLFSPSGFLELLADEDLDPATRREFLATMQEQVERLTKLATDLLDLSRLDAGRLAVERERLDLGRVADDLADEFSALARTSGHALVVENGAPADAVGDEQRVLQIGRILVENALRHTPAGSTVSIQAGRENGSGVLVVQDDGPGIPPEHLEHVFERFYRVDGARAHGSGLGLAIARELAELMGGRIEADSRRGRTAFRLALPVAAPSAAGRPPRADENT